jgi:hypothetical protein
MLAISAPGGYIAWLSVSACQCAAYSLCADWLVNLRRIRVYRRDFIFSIVGPNGDTTAPVGRKKVRTVQLRLLLCCYHRRVNVT